MSIGHLKIRTSLQQVKIVPTSSQTPSGSRTKSLLIPEIKTSRNKPNFQLKPKLNSLVASDRDEVKSEVSTQPDQNEKSVILSAEDEHHEFQLLFAKFARKVIRLEKAAQEYLNDGAPKRMRQEHKHYSYLFASTLGDFPKLASQDAIDRFVKKMRRFKETTLNLVKTCDEELNRFHQQNYYRNDMLVPPLKSLRILQRAVKNASTSSRGSNDDEQNKQDIKTSKRSLFSQIFSLGGSPSPSQATPELLSPSPILSPKLKVTSPPPPEEVKKQTEISDKTSISPTPSFKNENIKEEEEQEEKKQEVQKLEESISETKKEKSITLPRIETSSVLAHSQSVMDEDQSEINHAKIIEELKEEVLSKFLNSLGLVSPTSDGTVNEIKSSFTPVEASIKLNPKYKSEIFSILDDHKALLSFREENELLTMISSSKHYLSSATNKINKLILQKEEQQFQFQLSQEQALHLKALAERGPHFQEKIFSPLKVSEVVQDPSSRSYFVIYKCQSGEQKGRERKILDSLSRLKKVCLKVSKNLEYLLHLPDLNDPEISTLHKFEHLHRTVLVTRESIPQDFEMFPDFDPDKPTKISEDEVLSLKCENPESAHFSYFYAVSGSLKDSSGFLNELRSQLEYWEKYKLTIQESYKDTDLKWKKLSELVGNKWQKTEQGRALEDRYRVLLYYEPRRYVFIYGNFNQQRLVHSLLSQELELLEPSHKEMIEISKKSFTILQGTPRKEIEASLAQHFPEVKLYFHQSQDNRYWATMMLRGSKNTEIARSVFQKLELDMMGKVEYIKLSSQYWSERNRLTQFILGNELQLSCERNETASEQEVLVSRESGSGLWMRSHIGPREEKELEIYSQEMNQKIENKFRLLQFFFKIEESTFSIVPGREDTWSEVSSVNQFKLKRIALQRGLLPERKEVLKPREQLIMGRKEEMEALRSILPSLKHSSEGLLGLSIFIEVPLSHQLILYLENKYNVILTPQYGTNTLQIEGLLSQEALTELKRYWGFVGKYPRSLQTIGQERDHLVELLRARWIGKGTLKEIEIVKICSSSKWHNYNIEKSTFEKLNPKKEIQQTVFQEDEDDKYADKLFHFNLNSKPVGIGARRSVVLFHILIGKKLKSKEVREMKVPPTKASVERKKQKQSMNHSFDLNASFDSGSVEEAKKGMYYDTVEFKTEEGGLFRVFNRHHILPSYRISFSVKQD